jgi:hypothetical protein
MKRAKVLSALLAIVLIATLIPTVAFASSTATFDNTVTISNVTSQVNGAADDWRADYYNQYSQTDMTSLKTVYTGSPTVVSIEAHYSSPNTSITTRNRGSSSTIRLGGSYGVYSATLTDGQYFVEVDYASSPTQGYRKAIFYLNVGTADAHEPLLVNDWHPVYSDLSSYSKTVVESLDDARPEVREWVLANLGRPLGGCTVTPMQFNHDVFGLSPTLSFDAGYYSDPAILMGVWTFIPYVDGMKFESGDVVLQRSASGNPDMPGHFSVVVASEDSYVDGSGNRHYVVIESGLGFSMSTSLPNSLLRQRFYKGSVGTDYIFEGVLRPDWTQTLNGAPQTPTPTEAPNLETASTWARDGIQSAYSKGFIPADLQGNYTNTITRAEFCRMAVKWLEYRLGKSIDAIVAERGDPAKIGHTFSDTTDPNILAAYRLGITSGTTAPTATTPGLFTPGGQFSREQAATMIRNTCRAAGMDVSNVTPAGFQDIGNASPWAVDGINFCFNNKIMSGTSTTPLTFSPKTNYTREQSIITFNNIK